MRVLKKHWKHCYSSHLVETLLLGCWLLSFSIYIYLYLCKQLKRWSRFINWSPVPHNNIIWRMSALLYLFQLNSSPSRVCVCVCVCVCVYVCVCVCVFLKHLSLSFTPFSSLSFADYSPVCVCVSVCVFVSYKEDTFCVCVCHNTYLYLKVCVFLSLSLWTKADCWL